MGNKGTIIKKIREDKRIQQKELAISVGISQSQLSKIENNDCDISTELLHKISKYLGVSINTFFEITNKDILPNNNTENQSLQKQIEETSKILHYVDELKKVLQHKEDLIAEYKNIINQLNAKIEELKKPLLQ